MGVRPHFVFLFLGVALASAQRPRSRLGLEVSPRARQPFGPAVAGQKPGAGGSDRPARGQSTDGAAVRAQAPPQAGQAEQVKLLQPNAGGGELWVAVPAQEARARRLRLVAPASSSRRRRRSAQAVPRPALGSWLGARALPLSLLAAGDFQAPSDVAKALGGDSGSADEQRAAVFPPPLTWIVGFLLFVSVVLCLGLLFVALFTGEAEDKNDRRHGAVDQPVVVKTYSLPQQVSPAERPPTSKPALVEPSASAAVLAKGPTSDNMACLDDSQQGRTGEYLCPLLLTPPGAESIFAMPEVIEGERQEESFNVVDLNGAPLHRVFISELQKKGVKTGIFLKTLSGQTLAVVHTEQIHTGTGTSAPICWPSEQLFGSLKQDGASGPTGLYKFKHRGGEKLLTFTGSFLEKAITIKNHAGKIIASTERCVLDFDMGAQYYKVRVVSSVDAGLVICSLLSIDKLEKRQRAAQAAHGGVEQGTATK